ncbi:hypothetical protein BWQ96_02036 [Gracilariopsis chorda]|uniref:Uncharacterized protein n=1 Tax=Gracilariopsis chorda TaxID=448386 RepID=A0A2V3J145_9FLOR|nr:hypothetical protein BWQ96_02036 [Gracilariopsis chorda]|eukprot:PXF48084.1 hypothetical protein BWQ96_02036 [Gracilariopsis chorda]
MHSSQKISRDFDVSRVRGAVDIYRAQVILYTSILGGLLKSVQSPHLFYHQPAGNFLTELVSLEFLLSTKVSHCSHKMNSNPNFLNDLAAKMAAGPPKKPVGLVKQTPVNTQETEKRAEEAASAQQKLATIMKVSQETKKE